MRRGCGAMCFLAVCFALATGSATAQEVVHALCGTVRSINSSAKTITVDTDDGSEGLFKDFTRSSVSLDFDKRIRAEATMAVAFTKNGVRAIVYYFGEGDMRTAVALQDLGTGPFEEDRGTVVHFHHGEHVLTVRNNSGAEESFQISRRTVAHTPMGAAEGYEMNLRDGDQVLVVASAANGTETALFIGET